MPLFSRVSKQIWPQVLAVEHLRDGQMQLRHNREAAKSKTYLNPKPGRIATHN
jgi:hypothetical protein